MRAEKLSDYELIVRCLNGEKDYFEELVIRYKNLVYSVVVRMINRHEEAEDLAQEVFIKIFRNLDKYSSDYKFSTWVIRITTNHIIDYRRKKRFETTAIDDLEYELSADSHPELYILQKERDQTLNQVLNDLPEMYKVPLILYHHQCLSYQEIADIINEPLSKVKNRIFRGRKMLKESLLELNKEEQYGLQG